MGIKIVGPAEEKKKGLNPDFGFVDVGDIRQVARCPHCLGWIEFSNDFSEKYY